MNFQDICVVLLLLMKKIKFLHSIFTYTQEKNIGKMLPWEKCTMCKRVNFLLIFFLHCMYIIFEGVVRRPTTYFACFEQVLTRHLKFQYNVNKGVAIYDVFFPYLATEAKVESWPEKITLSSSNGDTIRYQKFFLGRHSAMPPS